MKAVKPINSLLYIGLMALLLAVVFEINPAAVFGGLVCVSLFIKMPDGVAFMALQKDIWKNDIIEGLFKDNQFATRAVNADSFVLAGKVVHIPVAGTAAVVKKNLTSFPQTAVNRADTEITYNLDTMYSLPRQVQDIEKYELSYSKRESVVGQDRKQLTQECMNSLLYRWGPVAANVVETTGADSAADLLTTATGTRKLFTKTEFKTIAKSFANTDQAGRKTALLTANHYYQFLESLSDAERTDVGRVADLKEGTSGRFMGFDIIMRSSVLRYRKVSTVWTLVDEQDDAFSAGTGDSAASLFWVDSCVERAVGETVVFDDNGNPLYYGDVFSAYQRLGGRIRRTSGVKAVVEAIGA